ncbi:MAG: DNA cytosine methyltransferase [Bryobacteraceae bacterium]|nr:DNA cytosine methyltransferase [Bryobacteraceae bacterium]
MGGDAFHVVSLCAGIGGLDLGLKLAVRGARTVCYVEREIANLAILAARMRGGGACSLDEAPVWADLRTFDGRAWRGKVHCVAGGYPCQPFSIAGRKRGHKDERHLWPEFARIIGEIEPEWVFLENVEHHVRVGFREAWMELRRLGYRCAAGIFSAEEVGAPHLRKRLFALAHREGGRRRELRRPPRRAGFADGGDAAVADPDAGPFPEPGRKAAGRGGAGSPGAALADAGGERRQDSRREADGAAGDVLAKRGGLVFPPGPEDMRGWAAALAAEPTIEPAVRGSADGASVRVDRLRALGNAVVPVVAAHAFRTLRRALGAG